MDRFAKRLVIVRGVFPLKVRLVIVRSVSPMDGSMCKSMYGEGTEDETSERGTHIDAAGRRYRFQQSPCGSVT